MPPKTPQLKTELKIKSEKPPEDSVVAKEIPKKEIAVSEKKVKEEIVKVGFFNRLNTNLSHKELLLFTKYLTVLLKSGLTLDESLDILSEQATGSLLKILKVLRDAINKGGTLASGLAKYPNIFSNVYINLIRAGEESGTLQENLENLTVQLHKERELNQKIKGAMMYPALVFGAAIFITVGIVVFILPNVVGLFEELDIELPITTRALLFVSKVFREQYLLLILGFVAFIASIVIVRKIKYLKPVTHWIILHLPVVGKLVKHTNLARSAGLMGLLLKSGMSIDDVLKITISVLKNYYYVKLYEAVAISVAKGGTISNLLAEHKNIFPPIAYRLVRVGEQTGTLEEMMDYVGKFYEKEVDSATKNMATLLEPFVIILIGGIVALIASAIISPIYEVIGSVS